MRHLFFLSLFGLVATPVVAQDAPRVAVDVAPLHGIVARVMQGVGNPGLVLRQGASPHGYALRPSEARLLQEAEVVFHIGEALTPWLEAPLDSLAADARVVEMMDLPGVTVLDFRQGMAFEEHGEEHDDHGHDAHDHEAQDHGQHDHDDHADKHGEHDHDAHEHEEHAHKDHEHEEHAAHEHGHEHGHKAHDHSGADPHAWMNPVNAVTWTREIAEVLAQTDPDNAEAYRANALAAEVEIEAMSDAITAQLAPHRESGFVVFHDAYQYFEAAFGLQAAGAITLGDASAPGAARLAAIQDGIAEEGIVCVFSEPQFNANVVRTVTEGTGARMAVLDPMGVELSLGPAFYPMLMQGMADAMAGCFAGNG